MPQETKDLLTAIGLVVGIVTGLWGAILSTYLAIREKRKERRRVKVIIEEVAFGQRLELVIVNGGFRPVTITSVAMSLGGEQVPNGGIDPSDLPKTIQDGDLLVLQIDSPVYLYWSENRKGLDVSVFDAEGNIFKPDKMRTRNIKWGGYSAENNDF